MKRLLVRILIVGVALLAAALVASVFLIGRAVKNRVEAIGPQAAQAEVKLDSADVWLLPGRARLKGLSIGNPPGCTAKIAFQVDTIEVRLNPFTALSKKTIIDKITVKSPEITLEGGLKKNNLTQLRQNVNTYIDQGNTPSPDTPQPVSSQKAASKKFEVKELVITGARLHVISLFATGANVTLALPEIHLTDLGASDAGITSPEIAQKTLTALLNSIAENASDSILKLGKDAVSKAKKFDFKKAGERLKGLFGQ